MIKHHLCAFDVSEEQRYFLDFANSIRQLTTKYWAAEFWGSLWAWHRTLDYGQQRSPLLCCLGDMEAQVLHREWELVQITKVSPASQAMRLGDVLGFYLLETKCFLFSMSKETEVFVLQHRCLPGGGGWGLFALLAALLTNLTNKVRHSDLVPKIQKYFKSLMFLL